MRVLLLLVLLALSCALVAAEEPWLEAMGPALVDGKPTQAEMVPYTSLVITKVDANGPAEHAGVLAGDRIIGLYGIRIHGFSPGCRPNRTRHRTPATRQR